MNLGQFSVSLPVKDIEASKSFYKKMGFEEIDGSANYPEMKMEEGQDWVILRHGEAVIGLFQGMFDHHILTFNPTDVRSIQDQLKSQGVALDLEADRGTGPAHVILKDPDGNTIMLDQHGDTA